MAEWTNECVAFSNERMVREGAKALRYSVTIVKGYWNKLFYFIFYFSLFVLQGLIARIDGNLQDSLQYLQKAIEFNPTNLDNLKEIAKTL